MGWKGDLLLLTGQRCDRHEGVTPPRHSLPLPEPAPLFAEVNQRLLIYDFARAGLLRQDETCSSLESWGQNGDHVLMICADRKLVAYDIRDAN